MKRRRRNVNVKKHQKAANGSYRLVVDGGDGEREFVWPPNDPRNEIPADEYEAMQVREAQLLIEAETAGGDTEDPVG
jgi:hypothetical protein